MRWPSRSDRLGSNRSIASGPYQLTAYYSQRAFDRDFRAATTRGPRRARLRGGVRARGPRRARLCGGCERGVPNAAAALGCRGGPLPRTPVGGGGGGAAREEI